MTVGKITLDFKKPEPLMVVIKTGEEQDYKWKDGSATVPLPNIFVMCCVVNPRDHWDRGKYIIGKVHTEVYEHQGSDIVAMDYSWSFTAKPPLPYRVVGWHYIKPYDEFMESIEDEY